MDSNEQITDEVRSLYEQCDPKGRGFITRADMNHLKKQVPLDDAQLDEVFAILDKDQKGCLTLDEFTKGFGQFLGCTPSTFDMETDDGSEHESDTQLEQAMNASGAKILLKDYDQVGRIWKELRHSNPALLSEFESMLTSIATEIQTARTEYESMDNIIQTKLNRQEAHLGQLFEELEQQLVQEKERLLEEERTKERKLREGLANELKEKENMATEMMQQYEKARSQLEELEKTRVNTTQEKERLVQEKTELEQRLHETESALDDCKEYIEILQKKAREDRRTRAKAAIELSENIALERENLVRQLDTLRLINQKLLDDREERRQRYLASRKQLPPADGHQQFDTAPGLTNQVHSEQEADSEGHLIGIQEECVENNLPEWASSRVNPRTGSSRATETARRGSILGAYFNAGPENSSTETELEGIAETDEDEDVFNSDHAQETRQANVANDPDQVIQQTRNALQHQKQVLETAKEDQLIQQYKAAQRVYKVTFIGDSGVGKSSIIQQLVSGEFNPSIHMTVAIDFRTKLMKCDGTNVILQLWDTAGQERFKGITRQYFRRSDAVVVVFDVTQEATLVSVRHWIESVREGAGEDIVLMILSNKLDKLSSEETEKQELTTKAFESFIKEHKAIGSEVSALTGHNIEPAFLELTRLLKSKEDDRLTNVIQLSDPSCEEKKKKRCC